MTSPSPFPNIPGTSPQPGPSGAGNTSGNPLLGASQPAGPQGPSPDQKVTAYMDQIRSLHVQIDALALQYPAASEELGKAKIDLANSMAKVAAQMSQPGGEPAPPTF